jgi:hypothetical protein
MSGFRCTSRKSTLSFGWNLLRKEQREDAQELQGAVLSLVYRGPSIESLSPRDRRRKQQRDVLVTQFARADNPGVAWYSP